MVDPVAGLPPVSIIIPCRNEERYIRRCLQSVLDNDYPQDLMQVLVVDGMSADRTRDIVKEFQRRHVFISLLDNPRRIIPSAMNIGIQNASAGIILKIDAHAGYGKEYIRRCVTALLGSDAANAGGVIRTLPRSDTLVGRAIVASLSSIFGVGNSLFRIGLRKKRFAATAYSGCYRRDALEKVGLYDERVARSEDILVNRKLLQRGEKILLLPDVVVDYYARSTIREFVQHNFDNGFWTTYPLRLGLRCFSLRHLAPLIFVSAVFAATVLWRLLPAGSRAAAAAGWLLGAVVLSYFAVNLLATLAVAVRKKDPGLLLLMPLIFCILHFSYGIGSLAGLASWAGRENA